MQKTSFRSIRLGLCLVIWIASLSQTLPLGAEESSRVEAPRFEGSILGLEVVSDSLALVIDISGSMQPVLPHIQAVLRKQVPRNPALHVDGTGIERPEPRARIKEGVAPETITAIDFLAKHTTATTILWITDFNDPPNVEGIRLLEDVLERQSLKLFLISVDKRPPPSVQKVIESREGQWLVVDAETLR